MKVRCTGGRNS